MPPLSMMIALLLPILANSLQQVDSLQTVAERSGHKATARHGEVVALCQELARRYPAAYYTELGKSAEGRPLPLLVLADPPVRSPEEAARSGKLVVLAIGNIHAGEVCGKEALPILRARSSKLLITRFSRTWSSRWPRSTTPTATSACRSRTGRARTVPRRGWASGPMLEAWI